MNGSEHFLLRLWVDLDHQLVTDGAGDPLFEAVHHCKYDQANQHPAGRQDIQSFTSSYPQSADEPDRGGRRQPEDPVSSAHDRPRAEETDPGDDTSGESPRIDPHQLAPYTIRWEYARSEGESDHHQRRARPHQKVRTQPGRAAVQLTLSPDHASERSSDKYPYQEGPFLHFRLLEERLLLHLARHHRCEIVKAHRTEVLPAAQTDGNGPYLHLLVADDEHVGDLLHLGVPDLGVHPPG